MHATRSRTCRLSLGLLAAAVLAVSAVRAHATPALFDFDDLPGPFVASKARSEAQIDRIEALAHFAAGRSLQQRGELAQAIRHYARADRLDPAATTARSNLVVAAVQERQVPLALRYALKGIDPHEAGDAVLGRLAIYLTEQGDLEHAIEFYEKALAAAQPKGGSAQGAWSDEPAGVEDAADIFTRLELGRLYHLTQKYAKAAEQFARVNEALEHPDRFGINERMKKLLLGDQAGECYELFGEAYLLSDRLAEAEAAFRKSQAVAPHEAVLKFNLARIATAAASARGPRRTGVLHR